MKVNEAYQLVLDKNMGRKLYIAIEYNEYFVFFTSPNLKQFNRGFAVNKKTKEIKTYIPTLIPIEELKAGGKITKL